MTKICLIIFHSRNFLKIVAQFTCLKVISFHSLLVQQFNSIQLYIFDYLFNVFITSSMKWLNTKHRWQMQTNKIHIHCKCKSRRCKWDFLDFWISILKTNGLNEYGLPFDIQLLNTNWCSRLNQSYWAYNLQRFQSRDCFMLFNYLEFHMHFWIYFRHFHSINIPFTHISR